MHDEIEQRVTEAFNSMLRTDYISLDDVEKLNRLAGYYVDYFGYLPQILGESDQLIVGRRGTGKTTLLYRAFVECMRSWQPSGGRVYTKPRTLGIYIDLSKCASLETSQGGGVAEFEHIVVTELCDCITQQLYRFWPSLSSEGTLLGRIFRAAEEKQADTVRSLLKRLAKLLQQGLPRSTMTGPAIVEESARDRALAKAGAAAAAKLDGLSASIGATNETETEVARSTTAAEYTRYRLTIADILRILQSLRDEAGIPAIFVYIDEFSALPTTLQGRFTTLLRKILGTHVGVFVKLCAITDNYTLGSSIILQRDLFEISLDLDTFVERNDSLNQAMAGLKEQAQKIVTSRLSAYECPDAEALFESPAETWEYLSLEAMGVPRTLGIVLQQSWNRRRSVGGKIRKSDIEYGIRYASNAYLNQMFGASSGGVGIPTYVADLWRALLQRAAKERQKERKAASHFLTLPRHEEGLKYLRMFFLVHLLTKGRTTKKESASRSLFCFDFGVCQQNNLDFTSDKNVIRQQRFVYDDVMAQFERFYSRAAEPTFECTVCKRMYRESELQLSGETLKFCPKDKGDLQPADVISSALNYTEEEVKIIGAVKSAAVGDELIARQVADDVGCYVQKVAKFGEKLDKERIIHRQRNDLIDKYIYFGRD